MSTPLLIQNSSTSVVVYLSSAKTGQPSLGLTHEDVIVGIKKEGGSFVTLPLNDLNFYELSDGFYRLALTPNDTDTLGSLYLSFVGAGIKNAMVVCHVAEPVTAPPQPSPGYTPSITTVFGYVYDSAGKPKVSVSVTARNACTPCGPRDCIGKWHRPRTYRLFWVLLVTTYYWDYGRNRYPKRLLQTHDLSTCREHKLIRHSVRFVWRSLLQYQ